MIFDLLRAALLYVVVPVWLVAGFADYLCHRASRIECTSGPKESLLHVAQLAEAGLPLLAALLLEINAGVILLMILCLLLHQATAIWDVRYANGTRTVSPAEQHIHGVLEMVPFLAIFVVSIMYWPAVQSIIGDVPAIFVPSLKRPPLPAWYLASVLLAVVGLAVLPYAEELLRGLRWQRQSSRSRNPRSA